MRETPPEKLLLVIPTLNEAAHIADVLETLLADTEIWRAVVVDGGSADATRALVAAHAARDPRLALMDNPDRIQAAGVNRAVAAHPQADLLVRADAHARYPKGYCAALRRERRRTGATAVTVAMHSQAGKTCFARAVAAAQNTWLGSGGAPHRGGSGGRWVDHGHHALIQAQAFRALGGYDRGFAQNEDAEFDTRLRARGGRIWLSGDTRIGYWPRHSAKALARQYFRYGRGRMRTLRRHRDRPALRQAVLLALPPALAAAGLGLGLGGRAALLAFPAALWIAASVGAGLALGLRARDRCALAAGVPAMIMHLAWGLGAWSAVVRR
ncbi:MAG: glycosyltransferase family 2 protein [Pseudomonadota bacterium]